MHAMLGKKVDIYGSLATIGFLRGNQDLGVAMVGHKAFLVRLSSAQVVRELEPSEDFDAACLGK